MPQWFGIVLKRKIIITFTKILAKIEQTEKYDWPAKGTLEVMLMKQI